jgi:hypothetical protein
MTWAERLLRRAIGDPRREVVETLRALHRRCAAQAQHLTACAAQAPTAAAESELHALAAGQRELAAAVAGALAERGAVPAAAPPPALNGAARNHWARVVAALEGSRSTRAQLVGDTPRLLELDPALADLLRTLLRGLDAEIVGVRGIIARADPQALD